MSAPRRSLPALVVLAACSAPAPRAALPIASPPAPAPAEDPARPWRYDVTASAGARELSIEAVVHAREGAELGAEGAERFVSGVELSTGGPFQPLAAGRDAAGDRRGEHLATFVAHPERGSDALDRGTDANELRPTRRSKAPPERLPNRKAKRFRQMRSEPAYRVDRTGARP